MPYFFLVAAMLGCAYMVVRAERLLVSTLWLALTSALLSILLYMLGAPQVAVIELSVGAGLVTVLFVFAFSIVGEETVDPLSIVPKPLVWALILTVSVLLGWFVLPSAVAPSPGEVPFSQMLWDLRALDVLAQVVIIFAGVVGLVGLLADSRIPVVKRAIERKPAPVAPPTPARPVEANLEEAKA